jgi:hypothetical protein
MKQNKMLKGYNLGIKNVSNFLGDTLSIISPQIEYGYNYLNFNKFWLWGEGKY